MAVEPESYREAEVQGHSMLFLLRPGDRLRLRRAAPGELRWGELIVILKGGTGTALMVHRLVWRRSGDRWRSKGDASLLLDPPFPETAVAWKVTAYRRGEGPWRELDAPLELARQLVCALAGGALIGLPTLPAAVASRLLGIPLRRVWHRFWDGLRHACCVLAADCRNALAACRNFAGSVPARLRALRDQLRHLTLLAVARLGILADRFRHYGLFAACAARDGARAWLSRLRFHGRRAAGWMRPSTLAELARRAFFVALRSRLGPVP